MTVKYGTTEQLNTCKFVIKKDELSEVKIPGYLSGSVDIELVNAWYNKQEIKSKAYQNTIDGIITSLVNNKGFTSTDIETTGNNDLWYQMMTTDANFINDMLLPNVFSNKANTPFYAYITNDNVFHLKSLNSMMNTLPVATIEYKMPKEKAAVDPNYTIQVRKFHQSSDQHRHLLNRDIFQISRDDGTLSEEEDGIDKYPNKLNRTILYYIPTTIISR